MCFVQLLIKDPKQRLGSSATGELDVRENNFFKHIDWTLLHESQPPFKPRLVRTIV